MLNKIIIIIIIIIRQKAASAPRPIRTQWWGDKSLAPTTNQIPVMQTAVSHHTDCTTMLRKILRTLFKRWYNIQHFYFHFNPCGISHIHTCCKPSLWQTLSRHSLPLLSADSVHSIDVPSRSSTHITNNDFDTTLYWWLFFKRSLMDIFQGRHLSKTMHMKYFTVKIWLII